MRASLRLGVAGLGTVGAAVVRLIAEEQSSLLARTGRPIEVIAANTPKDFMLQLDVGTCVEMKQDPVAWINEHPGRINALHLKDWAAGGESDNKGYRVLFGEGWGLIRASNTQPVLVARFEARTTEQLTRIQTEMESWLRSQGVAP